MASSPIDVSWSSETSQYRSYTVTTPWRTTKQSVLKIFAPQISRIKKKLSGFDVFNLFQSCYIVTKIKKLNILFFRLNIIILYMI